MVQEAVNFAIFNAQERALGKKQLTFEVDGIEVIAEDVINTRQGEFLVPKDEVDDPCNRYNEGTSPTPRIWCELMYLNLASRRTFG